MEGGDDDMDWSVTEDLNCHIIETNRIPANLSKHVVGFQQISNRTAQRESIWENLDEEKPRKKPLPWEDSKPNITKADGQVSSKNAEDGGEWEWSLLEDFSFDAGTKRIPFNIGNKTDLPNGKVIPDGIIATLKTTSTQNHRESNSAENYGPTKEEAKAIVPTMDKSTKLSQQTGATDILPTTCARASEAVEPNEWEWSLLENFNSDIGQIQIPFNLGKRNFEKMNANADIRLENDKRVKLSQSQEASTRNPPKENAILQTVETDICVNSASAQLEANLAEATDMTNTVLVTTIFEAETCISESDKGSLKSSLDSDMKWGSSYLEEGTANLETKYIPAKADVSDSHEYSPTPETEVKHSSQEFANLKPSNVDTIVKAAIESSSQIHADDSGEPGNASDEQGGLVRSILKKTTSKKKSVQFIDEMEWEWAMLEDYGLVDSGAKRIPFNLGKTEESGNFDFVSEGSMAKSAADGENMTIAQAEAMTSNIRQARPNLGNWTGKLDWDSPKENAELKNITAKPRKPEVPTKLSLKKLDNSEQRSQEMPKVSSLHIKANVKTEDDPSTYANAARTWLKGGRNLKQYPSSVLNQKRIFEDIDAFVDDDAYPCQQLSGLYCEDIFDSDDYNEHCEYLLTTLQKRASTPRTHIGPLTKESCTAISAFSTQLIDDATSGDDGRVKKALNRLCGNLHSGDAAVGELIDELRWDTADQLAADCVFAMTERVAQNDFYDKLPKNTDPVFSMILAETDWLLYEMVSYVADEHADMSLYEEHFWGPTPEERKKEQKTMLQLKKQEQESHKVEEPQATPIINEIISAQINFFTTTNSVVPTTPTTPIIIEKKPIIKKNDCPYMVVIKDALASRTIDDSGLDETAYGPEFWEAYQELQRHASFVQTAAYSYTARQNAKQALASYQTQPEQQTAKQPLPQSAKPSLAARFIKSALKTKSAPATVPVTPVGVPAMKPNIRKNEPKYKKLYKPPSRLNSVATEDNSDDDDMYDGPYVFMVTDLRHDTIPTDIKSAANKLGIVDSIQTTHDHASGSLENAAAKISFRYMSKTTYEKLMSKGFYYAGKRHPITRLNPGPHPIVKQLQASDFSLPF